VSEETEDSPEFKAHVLEWLHREQGIDAASVESVWAGVSSEEIGQSLFADMFGVYIRYTAADGGRYLDVQGEDMTSLWRWVVGAPRP